MDNIPVIKPHNYLRNALTSDVINLKPLLDVTPIVITILLNINCPV